jgi:hypothetical protein
MWVRLVSAKYAEQADGEVGRIELLADGTLEFQGGAASFLEGHYVVEPGNPTPEGLTPADGEGYLVALPFNLAGTYFWAEGDEEWREAAALRGWLSPEWRPPAAAPR